MQVEVFEATAKRDRNDLSTATKKLVKFQLDPSALFALDKTLQLASSGTFSLLEGREIWGLSNTFTLRLMPLLLMPDLQDDIVALLFGLFRLNSPTLFKSKPTASSIAPSPTCSDQKLGFAASPRSRLRDQPPSTASLEEAELLRRVPPLMVELRRERWIFALEHLRVSTSLVGTAASTSLVDLPSKSSFDSLYMKASIVILEHSFETMINGELEADERLKKTAGHLVHE